MKINFKSLEFISVTAFILGIGASSYLLFIFPNSLIENSESINFENISDISTSLKELYIGIGVTLSLGILSIVLLLVSREANLKIQNQAFKIVKPKHIEPKETIKESNSAFIKILNAIVQSETNRQTQFQKTLSSLCKEIEGSMGLVYEIKKSILKPIATFAVPDLEIKNKTHEIGEGLIGQVAQDSKPIHINELRNDEIRVISGLGDSLPSSIYISAIKKGEKVIGVAEIGSLKPFREIDIEKIELAFSILVNHKSKKSSTTD